MKLKFLIAIGLLSAITAVLNLDWQQLGEQLLSTARVPTAGLSSDRTHFVSTDGGARPINDQLAIFAAGRVEGVAPEINLFATVRERIVQIHVEEGDVVKTGQLLVELDSQMVRAELELAHAGVLLAQAERDRLRTGATQNEKDEAKQMCEHRFAEMITAGRMHERGLRLAQSNTISKADLDEYEARAQSTKPYTQPPRRISQASMMRRGSKTSKPPKQD